MLYVYSFNIGEVKIGEVEGFDDIWLYSKYRVFCLKLYDFLN